MRTRLLCVLAAVLLAACAPRAGIVALSGESMGSSWTVKYVGPEDAADALRRVIEAELADIDATMSTWKPASDLSRYNAAPAGTWHALPAPLFAVMRAAVELAADTGGAYDPTVGPLVELWGFGPSGRDGGPPDATAVAAARARIGWQRLRFDEQGGRVFQPGGAQVDLNAIAPGHALDRITEALSARGLSDHLVEIGGELRAHGTRPDGQPWRVAIESPVASDRADGTIDARHVIELRDAALGSSGDYRRFFESGGRRYAHRIDPRSGEPIDNGVASVTVLAPRGIDADPLATALSVLGPDEGLAWATRRGLAVLFIVRAGEGFEERATPAFKALLAE